MATKAPITVKLTDADVIAIVDDLRFYRRKTINTDGSVREIAALDEPALASIVQRREAIRTAALADVRSNYLHWRSKWNAAQNQSQADGPLREMRMAVHDHARLLGHSPLIQIAGASFQAECPACGASGSAYTDLVGVIFSFKCGTPTADLIAAFSK